MKPKIIDDCVEGEIRVEWDGRVVRSYGYRIHDEFDFRVKMLCAREFAEGWYKCMELQGLIE